MSAGYSRWEDAMIAQMRILEFYESHLGARYLAGFFASMNEKHSAEAQRDTRFMSAIQYRTIKEGEPVWVSNDMAELIDHARWSFEPEAVLPSDPWCEQAFVLFPKPIVIEDMPATKTNPLRSPDAEVPVRAVAWDTMSSEDRSMGAFWISFYTHVDDEREDDARYAGPEGAAVRRMMRSQTPLSLVHTFQWSWNQDPMAWKDPSHFDVLPEDSVEDMIERARQQCQLIQTTWRIAQQFIPTRQQPQRQIWRQARRKGMKHKEVTVITLRRTKPVREGEPYDDTNRRLTVRHWVRGYWAKRHFREGPRQVWVRGHVKGHPDLPFQATSRAWEYRR